MKATFGVHADNGAAETGDVASVVASLPMSLAPGQADTATLQGVTGTNGWAHRAAETITKGAAGVAVIAPEPGETQSLERLAASKAVPVVLGFRWASNPAIPQAAEAFKQAASDSVLVEVIAYIRGSIPTAQVGAELLVLAARLLGPLDDVRSLRTNKNGFTVAATFTGSRAPVTITAVVSNASDNDVRVRMLTKAGCVDLLIPAPDTARPATLKRTDPQGSLTAPTIYESSHRATWKRLAALASSGSTAPDLAEFEAAVTHL
ncbi:hypothetical protein [Arthrobacter sp. StoSoilB20]|uniref:hypothetical protein n=1 Tax=Arthrobacter sp. StoSoilB20 TaxID=2830995 RepID=UPI001CC6AA7B|nr:hypothetical protein [Arthrobacter sp. StoSoilB20]BCW58637.1 hypothetical protein StoSoilB20_19840 [Arthrobacter sp. StoSoilB20]